VPLSTVFSLAKVFKLPPKALMQNAGFADASSSRLGGAFHGHGGDRTLLEPLGQGMQDGGVRTETADALAVASGRHGDKMGCGAEVNGGGVEVDSLELRGQTRAFSFAFGSSRHVLMGPL
jgi:hypothetical protein